MILLTNINFGKFWANSVGIPPAWQVRKRRYDKTVITPGWKHKALKPSAPKDDVLPYSASRNWVNLFAHVSVMRNHIFRNKAYRRSFI
jgi:hypothetical protein